MEEQERDQWRRSILTQMQSNGGEISFRRLLLHEAPEFERLIAEGVIESVPDASGVFPSRFNYRLQEAGQETKAIRGSH